MIGYTNSKPNRPASCQGASASYQERRRRRLLRASGKAAQLPRIPTVGEIASHENLLAVFRQLGREGGRAPGPDGITYGDLGAREAAHILRVVGKSMVAGTYSPHPARAVPIPKSGGGHRTLLIRNVIDRVVSAALHEALTPLWEGVFLPGSMGFRPRRSPWHLLAELEAAMVGDDLWVLTLDDIKKAFDYVNIDEVMEDHRRYISDPKLLALIETVLRGGDAKKNIGIDQGGAYSPDALNVRLHHAHDLGVSRGHHPLVWFRYADNPAYLTKTAAEGRQVHHHARQLLEEAGLSFKGPTPNSSTDGGPVDLLRGGGSNAWASPFPREATDCTSAWAMTPGRS